MSMDLLTDLATGAAVLGIFSFSLAYFTRSDWRSTGAGRALMLFIFSLGLLGTTWITDLIFGDDHFAHDFYHLLVYLFVAVSSWRMFVTLRKLQIKSKKIEIDPL